MEKINMNKRKLIISSSNENKIREIKDLLEHLDLEVLSKDKLEIEAFEVVEDGETLEENSLKKSKALKQQVNHMVVADDSGLFVHGLNGQPGIHSSRYAGEEGRDDLNIDKLLKNLENKDRNAYFKTVISLISEEGETYTVQGICQGTIATSPKGNNGFGYDPVFIPSGFQKTFAELGDNIKNKISHRAKALEELKIILEKLTKDDGDEDISSK